ncbi:MAG TPA: hypothetical protein DEA71_01235 [Nitrospira sp.]|nr:hypothetical protein [Nitrospira sp.]
MSPPLQTPQQETIVPLAPTGSGETILNSPAHFGTIHEPSQPNLSMTSFALFLGEPRPISKQSPSSTPPTAIT